MDKDYYVEYNQIERDHWWFQARRKILGNFLDRVTEPGKPLRILDLGCATGQSVQHLSRWGTVVGLDCNSRALEFCRQSNLDQLVQGDAHRLPFADDAFDLVCGLDILEHLTDEHSALKEMKRVCQPGGRVLLTVPALPFLWSEHDVLNHHLRRYRKADLQQAISRAGLQSELLIWFNTLLFPVTVVVRTARRITSRFRPPRKPVSDFSYTGGRFFKPFFRWLFSLERPLLGRIPLPIGVSLLCLARKG